MSDRSDIMPNTNGWRRLSYTTRCGWVDWGHALPDGAKGLISQIRSEMGLPLKYSNLDIYLNNQPAFIVNYGQSVHKFRFEVMSTERHWVVRRDLSDKQRESVAFAIYLAASHEFEESQNSFPWSFVTTSGNSAEDLVSNLIGFYTAILDVKQSEMRKLCKEVSIEESLRIWDEQLPKGLGAIKNKTTKPVIFQTNEGDGDTSFPKEFMSISPATSGLLWVKPKVRTIDYNYKIWRPSIYVNSSGEISLRRK